MTDPQRVEANLERWSKTNEWAARVAAQKLREHLESGQRVPELIRRKVPAK